LSEDEKIEFYVGVLAELPDTESFEEIVSEAEERYASRTISGNAYLAKTVNFLQSGKFSVYEELEDRYVQMSPENPFKARSTLEQINEELNEGDLEP
jgi:hypothetical protein